MRWCRPRSVDRSGGTAGDPHGRCAGAVARLSEASELLNSLRQTLKDEFTWQEKRELVELLVREVVVDTVGDDSARTSEISVTYMFDGSVTNRTGTGSLLPLA